MAKQKKKEDLVKEILEKQKREAPPPEVEPVEPVEPPEPPKEMFEAVCAACGKDTEVPFEPDPTRPVFCRECYLLRKKEKKEGKVPTGITVSEAKKKRTLREMGLTPAEAILNFVKSCVEGNREGCKALVDGCMFAGSAAESLKMDEENPFCEGIKLAMVKGADVDWDDMVSELVIEYERGPYRELPTVEEVEELREKVAPPPKPPPPEVPPPEVPPEVEFRRLEEEAPPPERPPPPVRPPVERPPTALEAEAERAREAREVRAEISEEMRTEIDQLLRPLPDDVRECFEHIAKEENIEMCNLLFYVASGRRKDIQEKTRRLLEERGLAPGVDLGPVLREEFATWMQDLNNWSQEKFGCRVFL